MRPERAGRPGREPSGAAGILAAFPSRPQAPRDSKPRSGAGPWAARVADRPAGSGHGALNVRSQGLGSQDVRVQNVPGGRAVRIQSAPAGQTVREGHRVRGGEPAPGRQGAPGGRPLAARPAVRDAAVLLAYLGVGVAVTWPRLAYLAGRLPATPDSGGYVWDFWWVAHQVVHLANPWFTRSLAAPVGAALGYHTLMPLPGFVMTPVTLAFGPSASYNLLSAACPGLLAYAMFRAARLWMPEGAGAYAAGAFFGFSPILTWRSWYEVNLALGALFFPLALEAALRLRRSPRPRQAVILGAVAGASLLTDQESAVMTGLVVAPVLAMWLAARRDRTAAGAALLAAVVAVTVASPQIAAMAQESMAGGTGRASSILAADYVYSGAGIEQLFAPSPRLATMGMPALALPYYRGGPLSEVVVGYGATLTALALLGLVLAWRRRSARLLGGFWLGCSALSLGSALWIGKAHYTPLSQLWSGLRVSTLMPFTWFVQLPGMSGFREADRFTELALVGASLLAGSAVSWLLRHARPALAAAAALAMLETGWSGNPPMGTGSIRTMPTSLSALAAPIAADHSRSIVVGVPFGIRGGLPVLGRGLPPQTLVLATADGHPLADGYVSRIPSLTRRGIVEIPFYDSLMRVQAGRLPLPPGAVAAALRSARVYHIEWVVDWMWRNRAVTRFLLATGFRPLYRADGARVYRLPASAPGAAPDSPSAAKPRSSARSPAARLARSPADSAESRRACLDCQASQRRPASAVPSGVR